MNDVLTRLRDAHVRLELEAWQGEGLTHTLSESVRRLFRWFAEIKLADAVTPAQVLRVIERYAIELRVSGGITELSGEMSHLVFTSSATAAARLEDIMTPAMYEEFAEKVLALEGVRRELITLLTHSAAAHSISTRMVARALFDLFTRSLPIPNALLPAAAEGLKAKLLSAIEQSVERAFERHRDRLTEDAERHALELLDSQGLHSVVDEVWDRVASRPLSEVFAFVGEQDVEDFVVLVYEFWLRYRKTDFFRRITTELVDFFFKKYGQSTLLALIEDMGVVEAMVREEVLSFLPPLFEDAARSGALERHIRSRLEGFYASPEALAALGATSPSTAR